MWVRISEGETINVDSKVVRILKEDLYVGQNKTGYYISFFNSLDRSAKASYQYQFDNIEKRDQAFESINQQLETIDITRLK